MVVLGGWVFLMSEVPLHEASHGSLEMKVPHRSEGGPTLTGIGLHVHELIFGPATDCPMLEKIEVPTLRRLKYLH